MAMSEGDGVAVEPPLAEASRGWLAAGGVLGAVLASACCIGPLVLLLLGVSGAWIGNLAALEPFKPLFGGVALVFIGLGFRQFYGRRAQACAGPARLTKMALWLATALVLAALTMAWWAPYLY